MNYAPLNLKTEYSLLTSLIKIPSLIAVAKENNLNTLCITDTNLFGAMQFYTNCKKNNIKPIIGLEVLVNDKKILLYSENNTGYHNLIKLSTKQSKEKLLIDDLSDNSDFVLAIIPFNSLDLYSELKKIYKHIYRGYDSLEEKEKIAKKNLVYIGEVSYFKETDDNYLTILNDIKNGRTIEETIVKQSGKYFKTKEEILSKYSEDFNIYNEIISLCNLEIEKEKDLLPIYETPNGIYAYEYLKKLCINGLKNKFGTSVHKKYKERLKYELDVIEKMGFSNYFLVVQDYVGFAKKNRILVGPGRGSAAGSLVSFLLDITTIDPIKYDLLFERFLNPERISMPDIDIDFEDTRRGEVINYCIEKYGIKKVAGIITFATLKAKQVIRDVGRVLIIDTTIIDKITKMIDSRFDLITNYNQNKSLKDYLNGNPELMKLYKISLKLEGLKRQTSIHAAGIVMSNKDIDTVIPLNYNSESFYTTGYSMEYLENLGLLKMDFLGLSNLTLIKRVLKSLNDNGIDLTFDTIPENDPDAIKIFINVNTEGIFQFESTGMKNFLRKFRPNSFDEISTSIALFRPGPMNNIDIFINRKRAKEAVTYLHPSLEPILKSTYGIMIFQEQIMQVANVMASYTLAEADILRKAMSKKQVNVLKHEREKFIKQSTQNGYSESIATDVFEQINKFASYGFNKAHSVSYAMISYRMAYLKAHYKEHFMAALLSNVIGSSTKTREYVYEASLNGINVLKPDINNSKKYYTISSTGIRYPLSNIKNVGISAISLILEERDKKPFEDIYDFVSRTYGRGVNTKTIESLLWAGCFDSFEYTKHTIKENLDLIINYGEITSHVDPAFVDKPDLIIKEEYSNKELMNLEFEVFGFYLSNHPVTEQKRNYPNIISISDINKYFDKVIETIVYIDKKKLIDTKKNDKMCFLTGSDEINSVDLVLFPKVYEKYRDVEKGMIIKVKAKVEKRFDKLQLIVEEVIILENEVV